MKKIRYSLFLSLFAFFQICQAQIITTIPAIPRWCDNITVIYDATQGNGALEGVAPIWAHTGIITEEMGLGNWQHVVGNWGTSDPDVFMTPLGNNKHKIDIYIPDFYNVDTLAETVIQLAFVFRNSNGSIVGREANGADIFLPVYSCTNTDLIASITSPGYITFLEPNDILTIEAVASTSSTITLYDHNLASGNSMQIAQTTGTTISHDHTVSGTGTHFIRMLADDGNSMVSDTIYYVSNPPLVIQDPPGGLENGINYMDDNTVILQLWAPGKEFIYAVGDYADWLAVDEVHMKRSTDGETWWVQIGGLTPGLEYAFGYLINGETLIGDPYSTKVLDMWNDPWITDATYPNLKPFPNEAFGVISVLETGQQAYNWQVNNFDKPEKTDLVIYELLVRDFLAAHDYDTVLDTLDYLSRLGVNAIEFMPVSEFEGNDSWGYNPMYHMALDKYYGPADQLKDLIDECHSRGIAVILDVVYNHVFSLSPLARLYFDNGTFRPSPDNPWLNQYPKHGFNVGFDVNHNSEATREWLDRMNRYWIEEFNVDGFRYDLSKGFTQTQTCNNTGGGCDIGAWSGYDASRIFNLKRMADEIWAYAPESYLILEHFGDNSEETELANYGFMLWGNANHEYNEASMGFPSDFGWGANYQFRGWNDPHLVSYMESHDEERLMYKNLQFGNSNGGYDVTDLGTALDRMELVGAFFFTVPGPKMMWQFGELGFDFSINRCTNGTVNPDCRLSPKPIRWDYQQEADRKDLYNVWRDLIRLRKYYDVFKTTNFNMDVSTYDKRIHLNSNDMNVAVLGNFDVAGNGNFNPNFQHTGWWYEFFTQDSIFVNNVNSSLSLAAGEYRLYSDERITREDLDLLTNLVPVDAIANIGLRINPNPASGQTRLLYDLPESGHVKLEVFNALGQKTTEPWNGQQVKGAYQFALDGSQLPAGYYIVRVSVNGKSQAKKLILY